MDGVVVRYETKDESAAAENRRLVESVFAQLADEEPDGLAYSVFQLADGKTFVHVLMGGGAALSSLAAFKEFQSGMSERVAGPPDFSEAAIVGSYGMGR